MGHEGLSNNVGIVLSHRKDLIVSDSGMPGCQLGPVDRCHQVLGIVTAAEQALAILKR